MMEFRITVLGDIGVGKTTLIICLLYGCNTTISTTEYDPTIEDTYRKMMTIKEEPCILDMLDTVGGEGYFPMKDQYIRAGDGVLLVYSTSSRSSFDSLTKYHEEVLVMKDMDKFPMVIVANKMDLENMEVTSQEGRNLATMLGCSFVECSSKNGVNIEEPFIELVCLIMGDSSNIMTRK